MSYQAWHTLLELKEDHKQLGFKGWIFFITSFPYDLETDELRYVIANPTFTGLGVTSGITSYVLTKSELDKLFNILEQTFDDHARELEEDYHKSYED